jgi:hypothetical protein
LLHCPMSGLQSRTQATQKSAGRIQKTLFALSCNPAPYTKLMLLECHGPPMNLPHINSLEGPHNSCLITVPSGQCSML